MPRTPLAVLQAFPRRIYLVKSTPRFCRLLAPAGRPAKSGSPRPACYNRASMRIPYPGQIPSFGAFCFAAGLLAVPVMQHTPQFAVCCLYLLLAILMTAHAAHQGMLPGAIILVLVCFAVTAFALFCRYVFPHVEDLFLPQSFLYNRARSCGRLMPLLPTSHSSFLRNLSYE